MDVLFPRQTSVRHYSMHVASEFETEIAENTNWISVDEISPKAARIWRLIGKRLGGRTWGKWIKRKPALFSVLMTPHNVTKFYPHFVYNYPLKAIYFFDAWPDLGENVEWLVNAYGVDIVFFSAKRAVALFAPRLNAECRWLPEALHFRNVRPQPITNRDIDVVSFGRQFKDYHEKLVGPIEASPNSYLYEPAPGQVLFPDQASFFEGIGRSKISICFPAARTHPEKAKGVSTMTQRYLQSMASGCLVVGETPEEMRELFDYDPIVQADLNDPFGQIQEILANLDRYQDLIARNQREVEANHQWKHRIADIQSVLRAKI